MKTVTEEEGLVIRTARRVDLEATIWVAVAAMETWVAAKFTAPLSAGFTGMGLDVVIAWPLGSVRQAPIGPDTKVPISVRS
jgi:hypothetical protein